MKKLIVVISIFSFLSVKAQEQNAADTTDAYKFILDYAVPSSPAFTALDVTSQVTRGSAAKPLVFNAFTNFLQTGRLDPGISVDFSPYVLLGGGFQNLENYRNSYGRRVLANSMLSFAALKNSKDTLNTDIGLGVRVTLVDDHDLFANKGTAKAIADNIGNALANKAVAGIITEGDPTTDNVGENIAVALGDFYNKAYNSLRKMEGYALSLGFGYRTTAKSSSLVSDSLINKQSKLWIAGTRYTSGGFDIFGTIQGTFSDSIKSNWIAGVALGSKNKKSNAGAELIYDFDSKEWNYAANFEIRILKQFTYVVSLGKRTVYLNGIDVVSRFRVISNLRLNLFGH
jgi:hypothetical protein